MTTEATASTAKRCRSRGPEASRASVARNATALTTKNGIGMQKYWVYTGVGTRLTRRRETAVIDTSDGRSLESATDTRDTKLGTKRTRNCKMAATSSQMIACSCSATSSYGTDQQPTH